MTKKPEDQKFTRNTKKTVEVNRERRRQAAFERLGTTKPVCIICGESHPHTLENHHTAGRHYDDLIGKKCRNCHRKLSDLQKDHPDKITEIADLLEIVAHLLLGLSDFFELLIEKFREFAAQLLERANVNSLNVEGAVS